MSTDSTECEFIRPHLKAAGLSDAVLESLERAWKQTGDCSFLDFLVDRQVIRAGKPKLLDAVRKGYMRVPVATVIGEVRPPEKDDEPEPSAEASDDLFDGSDDITRPGLPPSSTPKEAKQPSFRSKRLPFPGVSSPVASEHATAPELDRATPDSTSSSIVSTGRSAPAASTELPRQPPEPTPRSGSPNLPAPRALGEVGRMAPGSRPPSEPASRAAPSQPEGPVRSGPDPASVAVGPAHRSVTHDRSDDSLALTDTVPPYRHPGAAKGARETLTDILKRLPVPDRSAPPRTPTPVAPSLRFPKVGEQVGRYLLQERLGEGSTAIIFRSFHPALGVPIAVKVFRPETRSGDLFSEARILAKLDHPNIVRVLDVDDGEGIPYIVFEYVGSMTLEDLVTASGRLPCERVLELGFELASGLTAAHEQSLLHRDVKPSNVLMRRDGRPKLVDFGLATVKNQLQGPDGRTACGSPAYMAPEQILRPADVDHRTDMYGLGATLYHAAAGEPPISKPTPAETLKAQLHEFPKPLLHRVDGFDPGLSSFIETLLHKRPDERFGSWEVVLDQLVDLRNERLGRSGPGAPPNKTAVRTFQRAWSSIWHR